MGTKQSIADRLRQARGRMTQGEVAKVLGIHTNTIGKYERGERSPDANYLISFCLEFNLNPNWLLFGIEPIHTNEFSNKRSYFENQIDAAEQLVLDLMESEGFSLEKDEFNAVVNVLRTDILVKTKAILAFAKKSHQNHSTVVSHSREKVRRVFGRLLYLLEWSDEEKYAWLLTNYGSRDIESVSFPIEKAAGHIFDIFVEKFGHDAAMGEMRWDCSVFSYQEDENGLPLTVDDFREIARKQAIEEMERAHRKAEQKYGKKD